MLGTQSLRLPTKLSLPREISSGARWLRCRLPVHPNARYVGAWQVATTLGLLLAPFRGNQVQDTQYVQENVLVLSIDEDARAVIARFHGAIRARDFQRARERIVRQRGWEPGYAHIFDFTDVTSLDLTTAEIRAAARTAPADPSAIELFIAKRCSLSLGLARMIQAYAGGLRTVHVVESMGRALAIARSRPLQAVRNHAKSAFGGHAKRKSTRSKAATSKRRR
jgi:hypothetical protein